VVRVEVTQEVAGDAAGVFARYCDHESWSRWAGLGPVRLVTEGKSERNGVGAVRQMGVGIRVREEVVEFEPPVRMAYRVVSGAFPIRDHLGEVEFRQEGDKTRITWRCRFEPLVPATGWLLEAVTKAVFQRVLRRLAKARAVSSDGRG
jgi:hypothetical protein